jgi:hypothetical protein
MFVHEAGYFDVLGFIVACCALLIPAGGLYPAIITTALMFIILVHHLHFLLYCPVIFFICFLRYSVARNRFSNSDLAYLAGCGFIVCLTFLVVLRYGAAPVPRDVLLEHMRSRALDAFPENRVEVWFRSIDEEMRRTGERLVLQAMYLPVYALQILVHVPLIGYFGRVLRALERPSHRLMAFAALSGISAAYIPIFIVAFDYNRWLSNWAVSMLLTIHALRHFADSAYSRSVNRRAS